MFAVIFLKKQAKYLLAFLKQVQRHVTMRILNVDPVYSESDKEYNYLNRTDYFLVLDKLSALLMDIVHTVQYLIIWLFFYILLQICKKYKSEQNS